MSGPSDKAADIHAHRARLRRQALRRRERLAEAADAGAARRVMEEGLKLIASLAPAGAVVAGYVPVRGELDIMPLLRALVGRGHDVVLPVVARRDAPLVFRRWRPGMKLKAARFNIPAPPEEAPELTPDIVLTPLAAFDRVGHRLGYGGGYYDRTLADLRASRPAERGDVIAIGCAWAGQEIDCIPTLGTDERLDWILTEKGARRMAAGEN